MRSPSKLIFTCKRIYRTSRILLNPSDSLFESVVSGTPDLNSVLPSGRDCSYVACLAHAAIHKYQLLMMLVVMVMVWVSILKARGPKREENRNTSNEVGVVGERESGRNSCWDRWIITHVSLSSSSCLWVLKGTNSTT